jgi:esterase/lipase
MPESILLLHGFTASPHQFRQREAFYARGYNVLIPRPYHGLADTRPSSST